jgi:hypothetical protein
MFLFIMKKVTFTITEDEIRDVARNEHITHKKLSDKQIQSILDMVECDEWLWKDITSSIIGAIREELDKDH